MGPKINNITEETNLPITAAKSVCEAFRPIATAENTVNASCMPSEAGVSPTHRLNDAIEETNTACIKVISIPITLY